MKKILLSALLFLNIRANFLEKEYISGPGAMFVISVGAATTNYLLSQVKQFPKPVQKYFNIKAKVFLLWGTATSILLLLYQKGKLEILSKEMSEKNLAIMDLSLIPKSLKHILINIFIGSVPLLSENITIGSLFNQNKRKAKPSFYYL